MLQTKEKLQHYLAKHFDISSRTPIELKDFSQAGDLIYFRWVNSDNRYRIEHYCTISVKESEFSQYEVKNLDPWPALLE